MGLSLSLDKISPRFFFSIKSTDAKVSYNTTSHTCCSEAVVVVAAIMYTQAIATINNDFAEYYVRGSADVFTREARVFHRDGINRATCLPILNFSIAYEVGLVFSLFLD